MDVNAGQAVQRVDAGNGVCARRLGRAGLAGNVLHNGGQLGHHGLFRLFAHPGGHHFNGLFVAAHRGAAARFRHAVRAREVQLKAVCAGLVKHARHFAPLLFHQALGVQKAYPNAVLGEALFQPAGVLGPFFNGLGAAQLEVGKAHNVAVGAFHRRNAGVHVLRLAQGIGQRFQHCAAPARLKTPCHHLYVGGGGCRGEHEGVGHGNTGKVHF